MKYCCRSQFPGTISTVAFKVWGSLLTNICVFISPAEIWTSYLQTQVCHFYSKTNQLHNISNLFYFGIILYMFRTVSQSIIRSLRLYIQHQVCVIQILWLFFSKKEVERSISFPLASSHRICMTYNWCCMYSLSLPMVDGETVRKM